MDFRETDKEAIEHLTGRVPIFLSVLLSIKPETLPRSQGGEDKSPEGGPKAGEDLLVAETLPISMRTISPAFVICFGDRL